MGNDAKQYHIHVPEGEDTQTVVIREGEATPIELPIQLKITGTIAAPRFYYQNRKELMKLNLCHVQFNRESGKITLFDEEREPRGTVITGLLQMNSKVNEWQINTPKRWQVKDLGDFIRLRRLQFASNEEYVNLFVKLQQFVAQFKAEIAQQDDRKGNTLAKIEKHLTTEIPLGFDLFLPIYKGEKTTKFHVETYSDLKENDVLFWLESVELIEGIEKQKDEILYRELEGLSDLLQIEV